MLEELGSNDMMEIDGGMPFIVGVLAAGGVVLGTGVVVAGAVYAVGKTVQWIGDKITGWWRAVNNIIIKWESRNERFHDLWTYIQGIVANIG